MKTAMEKKFFLQKQTMHVFILLSTITFFFILGNVCGILLTIDVIGYAVDRKLKNLNVEMKDVTDCNNIMKPVSYTHLRAHET